jgi:hypothetical protein
MIRCWSRIWATQRLVARDQDEAEDLIEECLQTSPLAEVYDTVLVPALSAAKKDYTRDNLTEDELHFIVQATREIIEDLSLHPPSSTSPEATAEAPAEPDNGTASLSRVQIVASPAHDGVDELALLMLQQLLDPTRYEVELLPATMLTSEVVALMEQKPVGLLCLIALAPGGVAQLRYLCKRLRSRLPELKIVVGQWGLPELSVKSADLLRAAGANYIGKTLDETCSQIAQLESIARSPAPPELPQQVAP